ncbi:ATP-binding protein [Dyadobacter arcticus]|uniref:histidine kinase n=1 Tax=Dyadobacter arcticus TaxID=1078754 RepID=A0ABX0UIZ1_9BACT|nr:ATP-binding protein [Dyadobacter arcticus]NIJ52966.1 PAS domain S-box-containing protein [Dyadobacter arcticus]
MDIQYGSKTNRDNYKFLSGGGKTGELIRSLDWSATPLGPVGSWPQSLRSALSICLNSNFPIAIYWGKGLHLLYNDAWSPIPGNKHPASLGLTAKQVWPEIWEDLAPQFEKAFKGEPGGSKDALLPMQRHGYTEECYFDFTFTPVYGEDGEVEGVFNAVIETTYRVINERRASLLKQLSICIATAHTCHNVYTLAVDFFKGYSKDIPFAFLYTIDQLGEAEFLASTGNHASLGKLWKNQLPVDDLIASGALLHIPDLSQYLTDIPQGYWPEQPVEGVLVPLSSNNGIVDAFIFCGISARLGYDEDYKDFYNSTAVAVMTVSQNIVSLQKERERSRSLAELDRLKTAFFTNISHEFRTPLTLLLGPVEEFLADPAMDQDVKARMGPVYRNVLRMQKLVNTLLEFSRIEAGRIHATFRAIDISAFTTDLASTFRSAIEKAGLKLSIKSFPINDPVFVDTDMWEKIILNLISNAFKYTFEGGISLEIRQIGPRVYVSVTDTGTGIAEDQLDKLFDRFHRIENSVGRSQEGTGIGLALVKELVGIHKGSILVKSQPGQGSVFTIEMPTGKAHLPADHIAAEDFSTTTIIRSAYIEEALGWTYMDDLQDTAGVGLMAASPEEQKRMVLVADDNADMRAYIKRLLEGQFTVLTAEDGQEAYLKMLQYKPDLLVSDIMMPKLDGFGLLQKIRLHPELKATPVLFLSACAGEESKVEGLDAGADDYLVKPFSAKELIVRVTNHIRANQVRRQTEKQFYDLFLQAPAIINVFKGPDHVYELFHPKNKEIFGAVDFTGMKLIEALPELADQGIVKMLDDVYLLGKTVVENQRQVTFVNKEGEKTVRYLDFIYQPWYDHRGRIEGVLNFAIDVTAQAKAQKTIRESEQNLRNIITQAPVAMCLFRGDDFVVETANDKMLLFWGKSKEEVLGKPVFEGLPEVKGQGFEKLFSDVYASGERYTAFEASVMLQRNGALETAYVNFVYEALRENDGSISGVMAVAVEVTEQVVARRKIEAAEEKARLAIESAELGTYEVDLLTQEVETSERFNKIWGIGRRASWAELISCIHPDDRAVRQEAHQEFLLTERLHYEVRVIWPDQSAHWIKVNGKLIRDLKGAPKSLLGVIQDISGQKQFSQQLQAQVKERTFQLQRSNEDLQQFAHVASHDLKEPVRKVKLFSSRLQTELAGHLPEKGQLYISKIQHAADRMFSMIDGVLTYSSLNAIEQSAEPIDLNEIINNIEDDMEVLIAQKGAVIKKEHLPVIEGAPVLIYQLFYNLIGNSLKFSKAGQAPIISISCAVPLNQGIVDIMVADNGIGFEQRYAERIFETFARLNGKDDYEGTGLGLSLCKKIVERHNGKIAVQSAVDKGTKFTITIPNVATGI